MLCNGLDMDGSAVDDRKASVLTIKGDVEVSAAEKDGFGLEVANQLRSCSKEDIPEIVCRPARRRQPNIGFMDLVKHLTGRCNDIDGAELPVHLRRHDRLGSEHANPSNTAGFQ